MGRGAPHTFSSPLLPCPGTVRIPWVNIVGYSLRPHPDSSITTLNQYNLLQEKERERDRWRARERKRESQQTHGVIEQRAEFIPGRWGWSSTLSIVSEGDKTAGDQSGWHKRFPQHCSTGLFIIHCVQDTQSG